MVPTSSALPDRPPGATERVQPSFGWSMLLIVGLLLGGCAPSIAPLYRDYKAEAASDSVNIAIYEGLSAAGWSLADSDIANVVVTEPRVIRRWGLYHVEVSLEVSRLSGGFVRVFINPYRVYFTGRRSKTPYLKGSHARSILPELKTAFAERNIHVVGERKPPTDRVAGR